MRLAPFANHYQVRVRLKFGLNARIVTDAKIDNAPMNKAARIIVVRMRFKLCLCHRVSQTVIVY